jgi:hypothetical protein
MEATEALTLIRNALMDYCENNIRSDKQAQWDLDLAYEVIEEEVLWRVLDWGVGD